MKSNYENEAASAMESGDYDTAISNLEKALNIGEQDSDTMFNLAQAYDKKGDTENANKWYQKIIDEYPGTDTAQDAADYMQANGGQTAGNSGDDDAQSGQSTGEPVTQDGEE